MYKVSIVDDEEKARKHLEKMIMDYDSAENAGGFEIRNFTDAASYLHAQDNDSNIIFLDVDMPEMNGMELAKKIRENRPDVIIIFCTNLSQFAINGYEVGAFGFIVKPIGQYSFKFYMDRAVQQLKCDEYESDIRVKIVGGQRILRIQNIRYVEVRLHNLFYHLKTIGKVNSESVTEEVIQARGTMQEVEKQLEKFDFMRCSISYLINLNHVTSIKGNDVYLSQTVLPISRNQKKNFSETFMKFLSRREVLL